MIIVELITLDKFTYYKGLKLEGLNLSIFLIGDQNRNISKVRGSNVQLSLVYKMFSTYVNQFFKIIYRNGLLIIQKIIILFFLLFFSLISTSA